MNEPVVIILVDRNRYTAATVGHHAALRRAAAISGVKRLRRCRSGEVQRLTTSAALS